MDPVGLTMIFLTGSMCPEDLKKFLISAKNCKDVFEVPNALYDLTFSLNSVHEPYVLPFIVYRFGFNPAAIRELDLHVQTWKIP